MPFAFVAQAKVLPYHIFPVMIAQASIYVRAKIHGLPSLANVGGGVCQHDENYLVAELSARPAPRSPPKSLSAYRFH